MPESVQATLDPMVKYSEIASYKIVQQLPEELQNQLPIHKQIEKLFEYID